MCVCIYIYIYMYIHTETTNKQGNKQQHKQNTTQGNPAHLRDRARIDIQKLN